MTLSADTANRINYALGSETSGDELVAAVDGSSAVAAAALQRLRLQPYISVAPIRAAATRILVGSQAETPYGTASITVNQADGRWQFWTTAATINDFLGGGGAVQGYVRRRWRPIAVHAIKTGPDLTQVRMGFGADGNATGAGGTFDTDPTAHSAMLRFSTFAGDTGWRFVTSDGVAATVSPVIFPIAVDTAYYFILDASTSTQIDVYAGTNPAALTLVHSATATLPGLDADNTSWMRGPQVQALSASARSIGHGYTALYYDA